MDHEYDIKDTGNETLWKDYGKQWWYETEKNRANMFYKIVRGRNI